ncbi:hypothetical protein CTheo_2585 [Ceratobasidium theobromae]|uniref:Fungal-type protein kinase domain-containing protein n=1 Tax=Ceratobasidium theobromae TaxID=1582974 RepID=A0A5N5QQK5_9AGAM|nr:hypothetical protein CTheo_2585 [Ceratobasidium theobromae]
MPRGKQFENCPNGAARYQPNLKIIWQDQSGIRKGQNSYEFIGMNGLHQMICDDDAMTNDDADVPKGSVDIGGTQRNFWVPSMLLMQPGKPLSQAKNLFELLVGFIGALMGYWALANEQVHHRDINANNILLMSDGCEYEQPEWEWEQLKHRIDALAREYQLPEGDKLINGPKNSKYTKVERLTWGFDPKRRVNFLQRVIKALGLKPFGLLLDMDMVNILTLGRKDTSGIRTYRTGTLPFMSYEFLLANQKDYIPHRYSQDLESFFWVLLYTVAEYKEKEDAELNRGALDVISNLELLNPGHLGHTKLSLLVQIAKGTLNIGSFDTTWSKALAPTFKEFAEWIFNIMGNHFDPTKDPDSHFETVLTIFLDVAIKVRSESDIEETQATHICSSTDECTSCPLRDTREEGEEPKIP